MKIGIDLDGVVFNTEMLWTVYAELYDTLELKRNSIVNPNEARVQEMYNWGKEEEREGSQSRRSSFKAGEEAAQEESKSNIPLMLLYYGRHYYPVPSHDKAQ